MKLRTKLSVAECRARLGSATDLGGMALSWDAAGPAAVVGEFRGEVFRLHTKKYYQNAFAPFLYGKLSAVEGGAVLDGTFRLHPFARMFMLLWFALLAVFAVAPIIVPAAKQMASGLNRNWYFAGLGVLAFLGIAFFILGKFLGNGDHELIHGFLKTTLEASDEQA
jgi:hypothetical protein